MWGSVVLGAKLMVELDDLFVVSSESVTDFTEDKVNDRVEVSKTLVIKPLGEDGSPVVGPETVEETFLV